MRHHLALAACILAAALMPVAPSAAGPAQATILGHDVALTIEPATHRLTGRDRLSVEGPGELTFYLSRGLSITSAAAGGRGLTAAPSGEHGGLTAWRLTLPAGAREVSVDYSGTVFEAPRPGPRQGLSTETSGLIGAEGLYLPLAAAFRPWQPQERETGIKGEGIKGTFPQRLSVDSPAGYEAVGLGRLEGRKVSGGRTHVTWQAEDGRRAFLIGGPLSMREERAAGVPLYLYFYPEDADLAPVYAAKLREIMPLYTGLLGPFPYEKFAVVENFFPTGYGFPSLTLLGKQVVRLPFILEGSLAHEFVHSWWGESVEPKGGNWAEGLTAYLSDYYLVERQGQVPAAAERRRMLERFSTYAPRLTRPLAAFDEPGERAGDVLGYTFGALVWHELRGQVGDGAFFQALRLASSRFRHSEASWGDLRRCFEEASGQDLGWFFRQWVEWPGAPVLSLGGGRVMRAGQGWRTTVTLSQEPQGGHLWRLRVPVVLELAGGGRESRTLDLAGAKAELEFSSAAAPRRLVVDPEAQVLRVLSQREIPYSLHRFFAAPQRAYVVAAQGALAGVAKEAAQRLAAAEPGEVVEVAGLKGAGQDTALMFVGGLPPAFEGRFKGAPRPEGEGGFSYRGRHYGPEASLVAVSPDLAHPGQALALIYGRTKEGLLSAARLIPHLGRYGWAVFLPGERPVKGDPDPAAWLSIDLSPPSGAGR